MTVSLHLFAFPVNLIVGLCIVFLGWKFRKMYRETYMTIALLLLIAVSLVQGFMPVHIAFTRTWPFVAVLSVFLIVLSSRLFLKFSLAGFGLWLALWAGMLGTADASVTHVMVPRNEYARTSLPFTLRLENFKVTRYVTGEPMEYRAEVSLQDINPAGDLPSRISLPAEQEEARAENRDDSGDRRENVAERREEAQESRHEAPESRHEAPGSREKDSGSREKDSGQRKNPVLKTLRVNHPVHFKGHQVYLMDYDAEKGDLTDYCIVMVTRQPWRWLIFAGILLLLAGALKTFFT